MGPDLGASPSTAGSPTNGACPHSQQLALAGLRSFLGQTLGTMTQLLATRWEWEKSGFYFVLVFITFTCFVSG